MSPSKRHVLLQILVHRWLDNRSFKMCGLPECNAVGYIADYVAIAGMQDAHHTRYTKHSGLTKKYMSHRLKDDYQDRTGNDRFYDIIKGEIDRWYVCVFEIKVSRNDFLNTFGNKQSPHAKARMEPVGTAHWVVAEKGICTPEELPDFWGLLTPYGSGLTEQKMPKLNNLSDEYIHAMAFDMLWLQMNCRRSFFYQMIDMAKTIREVHRAIIKQKPQKELLNLSNAAVETCKGFAY